MTKELKKRIITSVVLLTIVLNCLYINNYSWLILLFVVSFLCWLEFFNIVKKIKININLKGILNISSIILLLLFINSAYRIKITSAPDIILFLLLVCIFSDIGGYVVGKTIGGKKLTKISPNKTISGSIGSFVFSFSIIPFFINYYNDINLYQIILITFIISLTSQLGDLMLSYLKRKSKAKDTGNFLPGHGGILDRIDGILFAAPVGVFLFILFL